MATGIFFFQVLQHVGTGVYLTLHGPNEDLEYVILIFVIWRIYIPLLQWGEISTYSA